MSARALVLLFVVLAAAVAAVVWLDRRTGPADAAPVAPLVPGFREADVRAVDRDTGGAVSRLERDDRTGWRVVRPFAAEADPREVDALLGAVARARIEREVASGSGDLAAFGLGPPASIIRIETKQGPVEIHLGRRSPVGSERYAASGTRVVLVEGTTAAALERSPEAFRERRLLPIEAGRIRKVEIEAHGRRIVLERSGTTWSLVEPTRDVADDAAADALTRALAWLEVEPHGAENEADLRRALGIERLRVRVAGESGGAAYAAAIGGPAGPDGRRPAAREPEGPWGYLSASKLEDIDRPPGAFRDRRVATIGFAALRGVTFRSADGGGFEIRRADESAVWTGADAASPALDPAKVDAFLDRATRARGIDLDRCRPSQAPDELLFRTADGEAGRLSWGRDPEGTICLASSWRPGVLFTMEDEAMRALPRRLADLTPAPAPAAGTP